MHPWIQFRTGAVTAADVLPAEDDEMSDLQFLAVKEFENKLRTAESIQAGVGTGASLTASSGNDLYLAGAQVTIYRDAGATITATAELQTFDGVTPVTIETLKGDILFNGGTSALGVYSTTLHFETTGIKVPDGDIIRIQITVSSNATTESSLIGWDEPSGTTPRLDAQSSASVSVTGNDLVSMPVYAFENVLDTTPYKTDAYIGIQFDKDTDTMISVSVAVISAGSNTLHDIKDNTTNLQVPVGKKWEMLLIMRSSAVDAQFKVRASATADTADGTVLYDFARTGLASNNMITVPVVLKFAANEFVTIDFVNATSLVLKGIIVEKPA